MYSHVRNVFTPVRAIAKRRPVIGFMGFVISVIIFGLAIALNLLQYGS